VKVVELVNGYPSLDEVIAFAKQELVVLRKFDVPHADSSRMIEDRLKAGLQRDIAPVLVGVPASARVFVGVPASAGLRTPNMLYGAGMLRR